MTALLSIISGYITSSINLLGYGGLAFFMALESCNLPIPSEIILPFGGYLVSAGKISFWGAVLAGSIGGTIGSLISYYLGCYAINCRFFKVSPIKAQLLTSWFARYGEGTVFIGRLVPMVRTFISLPAGAAKMNLPRFLIYTFMGSMVWSIMLTYLGYILGENWEVLKAYFNQLELVLFSCLAVFIAGYFLRRHRALRNQ